MKYLILLLIAFSALAQNRSSRLPISSAAVQETSKLSAGDSSGLKLTDDGSILGIFVEDGGEVGIGNSAPAAKLDVTGNVKYSGILQTPLTASRALITDASSDMSVSAVTSTELGFVSGVNSSVQTQIDSKLSKNAHTLGSVLFSSGTDVIEDNANFFWDDTSNRLGIGINTPSTTLQVKANTPGTVGDNPGGQIIIQALGTSINANAVLTGYNSDGSGNPNNQLWYQGSSSGSNANITFLNRMLALLTLGTNGISRLTISGIGGIQFNTFGAGTLSSDANGNITSASDERLKDIQGKFTKGLNAILELEPIRYKWNEKSNYETEHTYSGFSAQNVQEVIPSAVGKDDRGYLSLHNRPIIAALVNSIKELNRKTEVLQLVVILLMALVSGLMVRLVILWVQKKLDEK